MQAAVPEALLASLRSVAGFDEKSFVAAHASSEQIVSIRYNPSKVSLPSTHFTGTLPVPWSRFGVYLSSRPSFTLDPWLHAGGYYVQEASSMFIEQCVRQTVGLSQPLRVLDLCAAPGGKSTLLQSLISRDSLLVCNEAIRSRVGVLVENTIKWGGANVVVTHNDPADFARLPGFFDVMVVDAPCSGSGLFRRDHQAIDQWSEAAVCLCQGRQQRILGDAWPALKDGGMLIYSTCSYSPEENEDVCDWICDHLPVDPVALSEPERDITVTHSRKYSVRGYRFFPGRTKGEGLFVACFRKREAVTQTATFKRSPLIRLPARASERLREWIYRPESFSFFEHQDAVTAFPAVLEQEIMEVAGALYLKRAGIRCGRLLPDGFVPDHELALSGQVSQSVPAVHLDRETALKYLRREEFALPADRRGWSLVQHEGLPLGWVKMLGARINNYYPKEWRILKSGNS